MIDVSVIRNVGDGAGGLEQVQVPERRTEITSTKKVRPKSSNKVSDVESVSGSEQSECTASNFCDVVDARRSGVQDGCHAVLKRIHLEQAKKVRAGWSLAASEDTSSCWEEAQRELQAATANRG